MSIARKAGRVVLDALAGTAVTRAALRAAGRGGVLPRSVWHRLFVEATFTLPFESAPIHYHATRGDEIGRALYWRGLDGFERETMEVFLRLARRARRFVDVGANTGIFTLLACAANPGLRAVAFEPVPHIADRLAENLTLNGLNQRCAVRRDAVSDQSGVASLHVPAVELPSSASLHLGGFRGLEGTLIEVPLVRLDELAHELGAVDLMKIDVEGFEDRVLAGMTGILERDRPALVIECNPDGPHAAIGRLLAPHGYRLFHLTGRGPVEHARIVPDPTETDRNWLCLPPDKLGWLETA